MHIAFLTPEYVTGAAVDGGLANYVRQIAQGLAARGHRATVLLLGDAAGRQADGPVEVCAVRAAPLAPSAAARLRRLPLGTVLLQAAAARAARRAALALHAREPLSLLQATSFGAPGLALAHNGRFPLVCRLSSLNPLLRAAYGRRTGFTDRFVDARERRAIRRADARFAPSAWLARRAEARLGSAVAVLRSPCALAGMAEDPAVVEAHLRGARYLLVVGTLSRIKGIDLLAEALAGLFARHADLRLVTCGRDDGLGDGRRAADLLAAACAPYPGRLLVLPALAKPQLLPVLRGAWGVVMPSRVDNYPNACLEAQALGVPVVGTDDSSLEELIEPGVTGFLARNGSAASLAEALDALAALPPEAHAAMRARIRAAAAARAADDPVGRHMAFYERVVAEWRDSAGGGEACRTVWPALAERGQAGGAPRGRRPPHTGESRP